MRGSGSLRKELGGKEREWEGDEGNGGGGSGRERKGVGEIGLEFEGVGGR